MQDTGSLGLVHYSFLIPCETITSEKYAQQIDEMHPKLQGLQPASINKKGTILLKDNIQPHVTHSMLQKLNVWATKICLSAIFFWPLTNQWPLLQASRQHFSAKTLPRPTGGRKCFQRVHQILKPRLLGYSNKQTLLVGKNVLTVMIPTLINKDVFEPSYNDLKFTVWNHNYVCTNLIN